MNRQLGNQINVRVGIARPFRSAMFKTSIRQLWDSQKDNPSVREAIVDTLVLALDMKTVITEEQLDAAVGCMEDTFGVCDNDEILYYLKGSLTRVNELGRQKAMAAIAQTLADLDDSARETVLMLAVIYFHFSAPEDQLPSLSESFLPEFSLALDVVESVPRLLEELQQSLTSEG